MTTPLQDPYYGALLANNRSWVQERLKENPNYFNELAGGQNPPVLWIGCSDSRVPANVITGTRPGEIFVHRNIANIVVHSDMNMLSVLDYSVNILEVRHVIVCGHYNCGGINAAMSNTRFGVIDNWLCHLKDVYRIHRDELDSIRDEKKRADRFVELNVIEQVFDLSHTSIVQAAWSRDRGPALHGWVYDVGNGIINDLGVSLYGRTQERSIYDYVRDFPV
jgi:carbonic anhydrase